ncbi:hypothetical protein Tco_1174102 [Tanacetum coccineum]
MSTQQDIYAAGSENRPPMLNKENYVPWSSRLLRYAKSRPNGKLIYNSIMNGPYVRRMIPEPGDADREVPVLETFHEQTDDELTVAEIKQMEADDQAIQTILLGLPEDIYAAVDSCETAQEIWLRVQQMMKGSDIGIQEKKAKLFNEWERFTSTDGESIESYYHRFSKLMNDFKRNKHFPEKIASNLKFLNNLQPEWSRHVTIVHQTKDLHTTDYTQLYDFLKYNQKEVDDQRAERLAKTHDPLALMANSNNPFNYPVFHQDQPSPSSQLPRLQDVDDLEGDDLLYYDAEMKLTVDSFDDLFYYLLQFEKLVNASRSKKLEKSHDPLALVARTGSSSRNTSSYIVTHPSSVVDYDEEFEQDDVHNHSEDPLASLLRLIPEIKQSFKVTRWNIQSRNSGNVGRNNRRAYVQGELLREWNATNETANECIEEAGKTQRIFYKVPTQNENLISQIEMYKERNRVLENITKDNNYLKEFLEADEKAKC